MNSIARLFNRRQRYDDLSVSIEEHIAEKAEELMESGMTRRDAERAARRKFGNVALIQQRSREVWQWQALESILSDLKLALRRLKKSPGFAFTVLLTLAIGIGANTAVFTVIDSILIKPLPYPDSDRLVALWMQAPGAGGLSNFESGLRLSPSMYFTFAEHNRTFEALGIWATETASVTGFAQPEDIHIVGVSDGVLQALAVPRGRAAVVRGRPGSAPRTHRHARLWLLAEALWRPALGGRPQHCD